MDNNRQQPDGELITLIEAACDGALSRRNAVRLDELLLASDEAKQTFIDYFRLDAELSSHWQAQRALTTAMQAILAEEADADRAPALGWLGDVSRQAMHFVVRPTPLSLSIAAVAAPLLLLGLLIFIAPQWFDFAKAPPPTLGPDRAPLIAQLSRLYDVAWPEGEASFVEGAFLTEGQQIAFERGLAEITFDNGARIVLEGPAKIQLTSESRLRMTSGRIAAAISPSAIGFTVDTPLASIVDLGTEFGVAVGARGATDVHVFSGAIEVAGPKSVELAEKPRRLTTGESLRIVPNENSVSQSVVDPADYVRVVPSRTEEQLPEVLVPVTDGLALWLAADSRVILDDAGRVMAWGDLVVGGNRASHNAWQRDPQARPWLVDNAFAGRPALRFDGKATRMLTTPFETRADQTLFAVFARGDIAPRKRLPRQILNTAGPPTCVLEIAPTGALRGRAFGRTLEGKGDVGQQESAILPVGKPTIAAYALDSERQQAELWVDGASQGAAAAQLIESQSINSRKCIGSHPQSPQFFDFFCGDIAELVLYNRALGRGEIERVQAYLSDKYLQPER